ncbi:MAG: ABC transporter substrate-binding protein [Patescibacteria group bacterium]
MNDSLTPHTKGELRIKRGQKILDMIAHFSATERVVFGFLTIVVIISALVMAWKVNNMFLVPIPAYGGSFTEGIVGLPRSINPVLAFTDVDRDLSTLIYSGLMKYQDGKLVGDLAENANVSADGLVYTFTLKNNIRFHDGTLLTTDDIEFTVQKIQDGLLKSPRRADWANVTIKKVSETEIQFILKQPYSPFLANTTIGILPKHIWKNVDADQFIFSTYNIEPIGSGPYRISDVSRNSGGIPESYTLVPFSRYYDKEAYIQKISIRFFPNEADALDAYRAGAIESIGGISPLEAAAIASTSDEVTVVSTPLPRIFGIFFNQNNAPVLAHKEVRQALDMAVDKERLIQDVLYGYGVAIDSPLPESIHASSTPTIDYEARKEAAKVLLSKNGWTINSEGIYEKKTKNGTEVLEFDITTTDALDLKAAAEIIRAEWEDLGARVNIKVFEYGDLSQNVIKPRKYDALLFGEFIGKDLDLYAFWHSSQRNSPGLNVSMYVNSKADKILEDVRTVYNAEDRKEKYAAFEKIVQDDIPAVFLYSPEYIYIVPKKLQGLAWGSITNPSDRWYGAEEWYIATDHVWKVFAQSTPESIPQSNQ